MSSFALKRITKELENIKKEEIEGFTITDSDNIWIWKGILKGPIDSPYEKGVFPIQITFNEEYPVKPPSLKFLKVPYHPNIYRDGKICIDILEIGSWVPSQNIRTIIISIRSLFMDPNPDSPANSDAAKLFKSSKELFYETVKKNLT